MSKKGVMFDIKLWLKMHKSLVSDVLFILGVLAVLFITRAFLWTNTYVSGPSMEPTLVNGERVLGTHNKNVTQFDIITFPPPADKSEQYVKRVIGLPGDKVEYKGDQLYINDKEVAEPFLDEYKKEYGATADNPLTEDFTLKELLGEETVPEGCVFVMGDNRQVSHDSRYEDVGFIEKDTITANLKFSFWPLSKFGSVYKNE